MKKRLLVMLMVFVVLLAGCGAEESQTAVAGTVEPATEAAQTATEPVEETEPATEAVEETTPATEAETPVSMGRLEGGTYINEYAGFSCELDSSWVFFGAEELQELPDNVKELIADTELGDTLEGVSQFTDMMAENVDEMMTMNVLYQKQSMQERIAFAMLSEDEILDATLEQKDAMIAAYAQAGMDVEAMEKTTVTFLGEERAALRTTGTMQDVPFCILQLFDYHLGQYSVTLSINSYLDDKTEQVLELFQPVA